MLSRVKQIDLAELVGKALAGAGLRLTRPIALRMAAACSGFGSWSMRMKPWLPGF
jgi:hypothetical protein